MTQEDSRKEERIELLTQPQGELNLYVNDVRYSVRSVLNISPQGIKVQLSNPVSEAIDVVVQYKHEDINLSVNGTIVWKMAIDEASSTENESHSYDIGINLLGPHLLFSLMQTSTIMPV